MNNKNTVLEAINSYQFDLTEYGRLTPDKLAACLIKDALLSGDNAHDKALALSATTMLACELLTTAMAMSMSKGGKGEWDQSSFSKLGDDLKDSINAKLDGMNKIQSLFR